MRWRCAVTSAGYGAWGGNPVDGTGTATRPWSGRRVLLQTMRDGSAYPGFHPGASYQEVVVCAVLPIRQRADIVPLREAVTAVLDGLRHQRPHLPAQPHQRGAGVHHSSGPGYPAGHQRVR